MTDARPDRAPDGATSSTPANPPMAALPPPDDAAMRDYLSGERLYGDDLPLEAIERWFADEAEGYANLGAGDRGAYGYYYHGWNRLHGFDRLESERRYARALAFGSAWGDELEPILDRIEAITLVDPSDAFERDHVGDVPARYVRPVPDGRLPLGTDSHDLGTCFGVLHHIPNVSRVVAELARVLAPGATLLLREPIVSMGDWRRPRRGLTRHERGIPLERLRDIVNAAGFAIEHEAPCGFSLSDRVFGRFVKETFNNPVVTRADAVLSRLTLPNLRYHATGRIDRLRPTSAFLVLRNG